MASSSESDFRNLRQLREQMRLSLPIAALIGLAILAIVLLYAWQTWTGWAAEDRAVIRETTNLAESLSQQAGASFDATDSVLQRMYFWASTRGVAPAQRPLLRDLLRVRTPSMAALRTLAFFDAGGQPVIRSDVGNGQPDIPGARSAWSEHRQNPSLDAAVGAPERDPETRRWVIPVSRRFNDPDGRFAGIVLATVSLEPLEQSIASVDVGQDGVISLLFDNGTNVVRRTRGGVLIGARFPAEPIPEHLRASQSGVFTQTSAIDGRRRLTAFRRVDHFPLIVAVGVSTDEAFAAWRSASLAGLGGVCGVIVIIGFLVRFLAIEIRRSAQAQEQLADLALRDSLTGLANRRQFDIALDRECKIADRDGTLLSLLMIDVDLFKTYNDRYGHQRGDDILKAVADCIRANCFRPSDVAARYGGEEFAVVLPSTPASGAQLVAEHIRAALLARTFTHPDSAFGVVTISIGVYCRQPGLGVAPADVLRMADAALYAAKRNGRNRIEIAQDELIAISPRM